MIRGRPTATTREARMSLVRGTSNDSEFMGMGLLEEDTVGRMAWNFVAGKNLINGESVVDAP
jgi:hypothetical protein